MGVLPPTTETEWLVLFARYQESPEFRHVNHWMGLSDFKSIFLWEYLHRLMGRLVGVVFFLPWLVFVIAGKLKGGLAKRTALMFVLGGAQGLLGWYMVQSGLVERPEISHYRLAAHLGLAFGLAGWVQWTVLRLSHSRRSSLSISITTQQRSSVGRLLMVLSMVIFLQVVWGALMAGTKAGYYYATFPTMNGQWWPDHMATMIPWWRNFFDNRTAIHFVHRLLGVGIVLGALVSFWRGLCVTRTPTQHRALVAVLVAVFLQFTLGVGTVWFSVPVLLASAHQVGAFVLFSLSLWAVHAWSAKSMA
jgi:cytochrome c oxidase assembly protein subunit 15